MSDTENPDKSPKETFDELKELVVGYAKQETTGPLKQLGSWVAFGVAGAVLVAIGVVFLALGVLRLLQEEVSAFDGNQMSTLPYLAALLVLAIAIGLAAVAAIKSFDD